MVYIKLSNFILCSLENDDMESSKHWVKRLSLIFLIRSKRSRKNSLQPLCNCCVLHVSQKGLWKVWPKGDLERHD